ncbi:MAG TPA: FAD-dependent oxidoreductase [Baekduia sp.]
MSDWDRIADVVVVGSGAAGLTAAITARASGLDPIVLERGDLVGGSTAFAGGGMWIPANKWMVADGVRDTPELALEFLEALVGDAGPSTTRERKEAFVYRAPEAIAFLEGQGMRFRRTPGYPDYHPDYPGASVDGRGIESVIFDTHRLGVWAERLPKRVFPRNMPLGTLDVSRVTLARRTLPGAARYARIFAHHVISRARGERLVGGGGALVSQLLQTVLGQGTPVALNTRVVELVQEGDRVTGVVVERADGTVLRIQARAGVMLGAGGFARNDDMRGEYHPDPAQAAWTSASRFDLGDGIRLGQEAGGATALMDEVWGGPSSLMPGGPAIFHVSERSKPGSIMVDGSGRRYLNEAKSYVEAVHDMYARHRETPAIPSWLIFDTTYRRRYPFGTMLPWITPKALVENGYLKRASSIAELARICGIDPATLEQTVQRFNGFAHTGVDADFHRGENAYDTYYGDPRVKPNPCLAPLAKAPFYATALYPGDLGTKGGLVTDAEGRVLREDGTAVEGLYASGNTSASVMGRHYPGPGVTLAPAVTFSYLAMRHAAVAAGREIYQPVA